MRLPLPQFSIGAKNPQHIAEVIETSTCEFLAQCLEPEDLKLAVMPTFGSIVKAADEESGNQILAVVYHATTAPIDSVHRARALGMSLDELREEQPQIFAMLKTEFKAAIIGFEDDKGQMYQYSWRSMAPGPAAAAAVGECARAERSCAAEGRREGKRSEAFRNGVE